MAQTLLALGALGLTVFLALNTHRHRVDQDQAQIRIETERTAGNVVLDVIGHIAAQDFDARTSGGTVVDSTLLTPQPFTTGNRFQDGDDVDDFHRMQTLRRAGGYADLLFDVDATVTYVDQAGAYSAAQTYYKEVTVTAWHPALADTVRMSQIIALQ